MKPRSFRLFRLVQLAVIWFLAFSAVQSNVQTSLAAPIQPAPAQAGPALPQPILSARGMSGLLQPRPALLSPRPAAPVLSCGAPIPESCNSLQVIMIIDDSGSMLYNDPQNTRFQGVENMLDILAKEYYLPAVDANTTPPDIQVALVHFSSVVMNTPAWKPLNPKNLDDWAVQAKAFEADITGKMNTSQPLFTDFKPALQAAAKLAADKPQSPTCPRLVMLFTDGVPNLGAGDLKGPTLTSYMDGLKSVVGPAFPRKNDYLYVTAFESNNYASFWTGIYQQKWQEITNDTPAADPAHAAYVPTLDLSPRMEKILGATIGTQSYIISPDPKDPTHYTADVPAFVQSQRLTYYKLNPASTLTVTGPDGKVITPDGQNITQSGAKTSIEVLTLKDPTPGAYQLKTSAPGGVVTRLILYKPVSTRLVAPLDPLLLFTNGGILIQLVDDQGQPAPPSVKWLLKAELTVSDQTTPLALTQSGTDFQGEYLPLSTNPASITACAALIDSSGTSFELFNGPVGDIQVDPITVRADPPTSQVCVPPGSDLTVPLQLIEGNISFPINIPFPVEWQAVSTTYPGAKDVKSSVSALDASSGS